MRSVLLFCSLFLLGCAKPPAQTQKTVVPEVVVEAPKTMEIQDYEDFTGRTESSNSIEIRTQVSGYLEKIYFKDGTDVPEGKLLFEIDPRMYTAAAEQARASVGLAKAHFDRVTRDLERVTKLAGTNAVSQEEVSRITGDRAEAEASVAVAEAQRKLAETNLSYTQIRAKFAGRLSRRMVDEGNIVKANETMLTTLIALDPIYATFDVDERTLLRVRKLVRAGKADSARDKDVKVLIGLADEDGHSREGTINFIDNKVESATGTLRVRAELPNPKYLLSPGLFVRVRLPIGWKRKAYVVPEEAIVTNQGLKRVYVVNANDEIEERPVKLGQLIDQSRVLEEGVTAEDRIVVSGLQRARAGIKVVVKTTLPKTAVAGK